MYYFVTQPAKVSCLMLLYESLHYLRVGLLTAFKCFRGTFSLKKKTINFSRLFNLYFQLKRAQKLSICNLQTNKQMIVFFRTMLEKILIWQRFSETKKYDFNGLTLLHKCFNRAFT